MIGIPIGLVLSIIYAALMNREQGMKMFLELYYTPLLQVPLL